jgi:hypothetical protein
VRTRYPVKAKHVPLHSCTVSGIIRVGKRNLLERRNGKREVEPLSTRRNIFCLILCPHNIYDLRRNKCAHRMDF